MRRLLGRRALWRRRDGERGVVLVWFALVLVALLGMAAFAVDLGAWYARGLQLQKAADAAAMAAVPYMPNTTLAYDEAIDSLGRNGFVNGQNGISVTFTPIQPNRYKVEVTDSKVPRWFSQVLMGDRYITMTRGSTAEYLPPIPIGNPSNTFGNDPAAGIWPNFWAGVNGPATDKQNGDPFSVKCTALNYTAYQNDQSTIPCTTTNPEYRTSGYLYGIDVPANSNNLTVQLYDVGFYNRTVWSPSNPGDNNIYAGNTSSYDPYIGVDMKVELYQPDLTPFDYSNNQTIVGTGQCTTGTGALNLPYNTSAATYKDQWATICRINGLVNGGVAGTYLLRVIPPEQPAPFHALLGMNGYSVKATTSANPQPRVYGIGDVSIFANISNGTASLYLADIAQAYAGKTLQVKLFDPGDATGSGQATMKFKRPDGVSPPCSYSTNGTTWIALPSTCTLTTYNNGSLFNGQWVYVRIDIPSSGSYSCPVGTYTGCWWKVDYTFPNGVTSTDRTTWEVSVKGNPVHLVNN